MGDSVRNGNVLLAEGSACQARMTLKQLMPLRVRTGFAPFQVRLHFNLTRELDDEDHWHESFPFGC